MSRQHLIPVVLKDRVDLIKSFKPTSPGLRHKIKSISGMPSNITFEPYSFTNKKTGGRNHTGKITMRHIGGGNKQRLRLIDFKGDMGSYTTSVILAISYDPNRSCRIALCTSENTKLFWRLAAYNQKQGDELKGKYVHDKKNFIFGEILFLKDFPIGAKIFNIETNLNQGGSLCRSAGVYAVVVKHENFLTYLKLPSKKEIAVSSFCTASFGRASNIYNNLNILGKAGISRCLGKKPTVRGEAMNPIDHPHGGKTRGGVRLKTVYGKLAKFVKTSRK